MGIYTKRNIKPGTLLLSNEKLNEGEVYHGVPLVEELGLPRILSPMDLLTNSIVMDPSFNPIEYFSQENIENMIRMDVTSSSILRDTPKSYFLQLSNIIEFLKETKKIILEKDPDTRVGLKVRSQTYKGIPECWMENLNGLVVYWFDMNLAKRNS